MSERKWTGVIILCMMVIGLLVYCWKYIDRKRTHTLTFQTCKVQFHYYQSVDTNDVGYVAAQNKLAQCVCALYKRRRDKAVATYLKQMYQQYGLPLQRDSAKHTNYQNLDTIVKYKKQIFDTLQVLDD